MISLHKPCLGVIVRANRTIGSGHLMRIKPLLPLLKPHLKLHLYVYAFDENLRAMAHEYDEISVFDTKEEILQHLLSLPTFKALASTTIAPSSDAKTPAPLKTKDTFKAAKLQASCLALNESAPQANFEAHKTTAPDAAFDKASNIALDATSNVIPGINLNAGTDHHEPEYLPEILLIDDYAIDREFEAPLYPKTKLFVIDGLYNRFHTCHKILDITLYPEETQAHYRKLCNIDCEILAGSQYSLTAQRFSPDFFVPGAPRCTCGAHNFNYSGRVKLLDAKAASTLQPASRLSTPSRPVCICQDSQANPLPRVFISFGGADPVAASLKITQTILAAQLYESYRFTLVAGMSNSDYPKIAELIKTQLPYRYQDNFILVKQCSDIADLLFSHELAIGAYGGMTFERVTSRIPTLGVVIADNQIDYRRTCDEFGFGLSLELAELEQPDKLKAALSQLMSRSEEFTHNCARVYDGHGIEHIASKVLELLNWVAALNRWLEDLPWIAMLNGWLEELTCVASQASCCTLRWHGKAQSWRKGESFKR